MSTTLSPRPLSVVPFIAADAGLLLTAGLIGWFAPGELTGGPLLAVVSCVGLGAVAMVYPFIVNDVHQREVALAERQRELAELVTASNAHASRWGTQWAAAATGLEDAAALASRSLAAAERLPVVFQQTAEALTLKLTEAEQLAQARAERAAQQESALAAQLGAQLAAQLEQQDEQLARQAAVSGAQDSALATREASFASQLTTLTGQLAALTGQVEKNATQEYALAAREASVANQMATFAGQFATLTAQVAPIVTAAAEFKTTLQEFGRLEASVREHRAAIAASLSEFPVAADQARSARSELQDALAAAPVKLAAEVEQRVSVAEVRLGATTAALTARLAEVEAAVAGLVNQLNRVAEVAAAAPVAIAPALAAEAPVEQAPAAAVVVAAVEVVEAVVPVVAATPEVAQIEAAQAPVIVVAPAVAPAPVEVTAVVQAPTVVAAAAQAPKAAPGAPTAAAKTPIRSESIMDPFIIPKNGYAALADAMDLGDA